MKSKEFVDYLFALLFDLDLDIYDSPHQQSITQYPSILNIPKAQKLSAILSPVLEPF